MQVYKTVYYNNNTMNFVFGCSQIHTVLTKKCPPRRLIPPTSILCADNLITYLHDCVYRKLYFSSPRYERTSKHFARSCLMSKAKPLFWEKTLCYMKDLKHMCTGVFKPFFLKKSQKNHKFGGKRPILLMRDLSKLTKGHNTSKINTARSKPSHGPA